jgi:hypothetical protein
VGRRGLDSSEGQADGVVPGSDGNDSGGGRGGGDVVAMVEEEQDDAVPGGGSEGRADDAVLGRGDGVEAVGVAAASKRGREILIA